ncbi:MAG: DUF2851 family protein [Balneola sp.]|nr:MAG: DUF2851 family protein [Balneola sp.]
MPEKEHLLQWIWEQLLFDTTSLKTTEGKALRILNQGLRNSTDGPDFLQATIQIGTLVWSGAIEIHINSSSWYHHAHHLDEAYNQVVLHVVFEERPKKVYCQNGSCPPTLNLQPYLAQELQQLLKHANDAVASCSGKLSFISKEAFDEQLRRAHLEYLEKKGNDILSFYNPDQIPSLAWKHALILALFDGFGIVHNRSQMVEVGRFVLDRLELSIKEITDQANTFAGFRAGEPGLSWNLKGVYPASHPQKRIPQAIEFAKSIIDTPFELFLKQHPRSIWKSWIEKVCISNGSKAKILYSTVFIPALHMLGTLFASEKVTRHALEEWNSICIPLPSSTRQYFSQMVEPHEFQRFATPGLIHQHRSYCSRLNCHHCIVLKKAISS